MVLVDYYCPRDVSEIYYSRFKCSLQTRSTRYLFHVFSIADHNIQATEVWAAVLRGEQIAPFCNDPIGLPERFSVKVDLQNFDQAASFGAPVVFLLEQVSDTKPSLTLNRKTAFLETGLPDPLTGGWYREAHRVHEKMQAVIARQPALVTN